MRSIKSRRSKKGGAPGREQLVAAIKSVVEANGGKLLSLPAFLEVSRLSLCDVRRNFGSWKEAQKAAGFVSRHRNERVESNDLLEEWGRVARKVGSVPTISEFVKTASFNPETLRKRFGGWSKLAVVFRKFAAGKQEWSDVLALLSKFGQAAKQAKGHGWRRGLGASPFPKARLQRIADRAVCGTPLYFDGMSHAPVNEAGVLYLFGAMAPKLGFTVESLRAGFPDCQAKRRVGPDAWQTVSIEFEYESRNYRHHGHPPKGCDLIVCWRHNWPQCPLKVIALSDEIGRLQKTDAKVEFLAA